MKICGREIQAFIFDLDGTLIDSTSIWGKIDAAFFAKRNRPIPKHYVEEIAHLGLKDAAILTKTKYNIKEEIDEIIKEWQDAAYQEYAFHIPLKEGAFSLLTYLKQQNIKIALATASPKLLATVCLERLKITHFFDFIANVEDVKMGKNSVQLYNYVSEKLQVKPEHTVICEDIATALKTAFENHYLSIAIYDEHSAYDDENKRKFSHLYIHSLKELLKEETN